MDSRLHATPYRDKPHDPDLAPQQSTQEPKGVHLVGVYGFVPLDLAEAPGPAFLMERDDVRVPWFER